MQRLFRAPAAEENIALIDALETAASTDIGGTAPQLLSAPKQRAEALVLVQNS
jgi:hypothetical protein